MKPLKNNPDLFIPDEIYEGNEFHPQCCFFELFESTPDPHETYLGIKFCDMSNTESAAEVCNGDYAKCPIVTLFRDGKCEYQDENIEIKDIEDNECPF